MKSEKNETNLNIDLVTRPQRFNDSFIKKCNYIQLAGSKK